MTNVEFNENPFAAPEADLGHLPLNSDPEDFELADQWPRIAGFLIDNLIVTTAIYLMYAIIHFMSERYGFYEEVNQEELTIMLVIAQYSITPIYFAICDCSPWQGTFGKRIMGIKVVDLNGHRLTFRGSCFRSLCRLLSVGTVYAGFFLPVLSKRRQTLHDLLAGCLVVRE